VDKGDCVVGNGNGDLGDKTPVPKSGQRIAGRFASGLPDLQPAEKAPVQRANGKCGAMSEQGADSGRGNEQVPQKLVHLVGTGEPSPSPPSVRRRKA
jgi:hypothetical protein